MGFKREKDERRVFRTLPWDLGVTVKRQKEMAKYFEALIEYYEIQLVAQNSSKVRFEETFFGRSTILQLSINLG